MRLQPSIFYQRYDDFELLELFVEGFKSAKSCSAIFAFIDAHTLTQCDRLSYVLLADLHATNRHCNATTCAYGGARGGTLSCLFAPSTQGNKKYVGGGRRPGTAVIAPLCFLTIKIFFYV